MGLDWRLSGKYSNKSSLMAVCLLLFLPLLIILVVMFATDYRCYSTSRLVNRVQVSVSTCRCLKATVSCVMCRERHLEVHLALLIFSWTSSCSGELLRARVTANTEQRSTKAARHTDITLCGNTRRPNKRTRKLNGRPFFVVSGSSTHCSCVPLSSEWKHVNAAPVCARAMSEAALPSSRTLPPPPPVKCSHAEM